MFNPSPERKPKVIIGDITFSKLFFRMRVYEMETNESALSVP